MYRYSRRQVKGAKLDICLTAQVPLPFNVFIRTLPLKRGRPRGRASRRCPAMRSNRLIETLVPEGLVLVDRQSQLADHFFVEMISE